jgi:enoyl-CoA hydratase/carnithine racemase
MSTELVAVENADGILHIRLNRPDKKNALNQAMYNGLADAFELATSDPSVRVALLSGTDDCFCSGNDVKDFMNLPPAGPKNPVLRFMLALAGCTKPVIAAVNGPAVGIGTTMLIHCDLIYAGESARFQMPFVSLGLAPEFASSYLLPRLMGHLRTAELILLAEPFDAKKALDYGLINEVLPNDAFKARALEKAQRLASLPPQALRTTKALLKRWNRDEVSKAIPAEFDVFVPMISQPEAMEAISAFMQKRKPDFSKFS